jgi:CO dehydrogenase/acetyl-CoA synthase epsilon subunit
MSTPTQAPPPDEWKPSAPALRERPENVYSVLSKASRALMVAGRHHQVREMQRRVFAAKSDGDAIAIMGEYVEWGAE